MDERHTTQEVIDYFQEGNFLRFKNDMAIQFLIAALLEHYARNVSRDWTPMLNTAIGQALVTLEGDVPLERLLP